MLGGSILQKRKLRLREGKMQGGRDPGPQRHQRAWGGGSWGFPSLCWAWSVTLEQGWGQALSPEVPTWLSGLWPVEVTDPPVRGRGGGVPSSGLGDAGPAPTAAAWLAGWPHRQTGLMRARPSRGAQLLPAALKGFIVAGGPFTGSCPRCGTDRAQPLCQRAGPALTQGQRDRGSCLQGAGDLPGEGLPWAHRRPGMGVVHGARPWEPPPTSQIPLPRGRVPGWRLAWGGGVAPGRLAGHTVTTW